MLEESAMMTCMDDVRYYSLRRLSPYQGTVQVVDLPGFRAMSPDGITWQVRVQSRYPRFAGRAVWRADGSGNLIETDRMRAFFDAMRAAPPLPFPLADRQELWLLDGREQAPLALLASSLERAAPPPTLSPQWRAALAGDDSFVSRTFSSGNTVSLIAHRELVSRCVQKAAGARLQAQWFVRAEDGSGTGLGGSGDALRGRRLVREAFPELLVSEHWETEAERGLLRDYHDWLAPGLLTHSNLTRGTRDRLEQAACRQAEKLYHLRQLLPEVLNPDLVKVAMVEAVMRRAAASP
jgi:hypothetical protein